MAPQPSCQGTVRDAQGEVWSERSWNYVRAAMGQTRNSSATERRFHFRQLASRLLYGISKLAGTGGHREEPVVVQEGASLRIELTVASDGRLILKSLGWAACGKRTLMRMPRRQRDLQSSGGERLSSKQVSSLPLNKRDFSQLLLLAGGTQTDTNGSSNFTQQFAVNGQREPPRYSPWMAFS